MHQGWFILCWNTTGNDKSIDDDEQSLFQPSNNNVMVHFMNIAHFQLLNKTDSIFELSNKSTELTYQLYGIELNWNGKELYGSKTKIKNKKQGQENETQQKEKERMPSW